MLKLVTNPRIREKMERVGKAIQEAGIDPAEAKVRPLHSMAGLRSHLHTGSGRLG